jgi:hypothetical protein
MPAGFPVKQDYSTGDVLTAANMNDLASTLNYLDPTAKGDLFPASSGTALTRLAVGANGEILVADSSTATGLDWKSSAEQYPWTAYTPTVTSSIGTPTTVTASGAYQKIGKTVIVRMLVTVTNAGTAAGNMSVDLPFTGANVRQSGTGAEFTLTGDAAVVLLEANATVAVLRKYDFTTFWTTGAVIAAQITYEEA